MKLTNLQPNPWPVAGGSWWTTGGSMTAGTYVAGGFQAAVNWSGGTAGQRLGSVFGAVFYADQGKILTVSVKVTGPAGRQVRLSMLGAPGPGPIITLSSVETTLSTTVTVTTTGGLQPQVELMGVWASGDTVTVRQMMITEGSNVYPYFDGGTPDTPLIDYAWTGTPNASASVRTTTEAEISVAEVYGHTARVTLTVTDPIPGQLVTIYADDLTGPRRPVLGAQDVPLTSNVWDDPEVPLGRPVYYVAVVGGYWEVATGGPVTIAAATPRLSDPYTGTSLAATIQKWPELAYERRATVVDVEGDRRRRVLQDVEACADSTVVLRTDDGPALLQLRALMADGRPLLLRASCPGVEDTWLHVIGQRLEQRVTTRSDDHRRYHTLDVQHLDGPPDPTRRPVTDTLDDVDLAVGRTTLQAVANRWGTLGDIASTDLRGGRA